MVEAAVKANQMKKEELDAELNSAKALTLVTPDSSDGTPVTSAGTVL